MIKDLVNEHLVIRNLVGPKQNFKTYVQFLKKFYEDFKKDSEKQADKLSSSTYKLGQDLTGLGKTVKEKLGDLNTQFTNRLEERAT